MPTAQPDTTAHHHAVSVSVYRSLIRQAALLCMVVHTLFIGLFAWTGVSLLAWVNVFSVVAHAGSWFLARSDRHLRVAALILGTEVAAHAFLATGLIGWGSGFHYLIIPMFPIVMVASNLTQRSKYLYVSLLATAYVALDLWTDTHPPAYWLPEVVEDVLRLQNVLTEIAALSILASCYFGVITRAQKALAQQASTDPLTGALNRRRLLEIARQHSARQRRLGGSMSILLCDIDHFKRINDTYGHDAGDVALREFHSRLKALSRQADSIARWGGEEFLVLLPDTDASGAFQLAERMRQTIDQKPFTLDDNSPLAVSVTIGLTEVQPTESVLDALPRADSALYRGKQQGRNRVVVAHHNEPPLAEPAHPSPATRQG